MFKTLLRSVVCFCAAVLLLALSLCAVEVGCRTIDFMASRDPNPNFVKAEDLVKASPICWLEPRRLLDVRTQISNGESIGIRTNELGLRGSSVMIPKPNDVFRILVLGGSSIFGMEQEESQTIPAHLQRYLTANTGLRTEVINAGVPSSGPLCHFLRYRNGLSALQADLVILCVSVDDLSFDSQVRSALRLDDARLPAYSSHPGAVKGPESTLESLRRDYLSISWSLDWLANSMSGPARPPVITSPEGGYGKRELGAIAALSELVQNNNSLLIVSPIPSAWGVEQTIQAVRHQRPTFSDDLRRVLSELKVSQRVPVHDVILNFCEIPEPRRNFSSTLGLLTTAGGDTYSQTLAEFLMTRVNTLADARERRAINGLQPIIMPAANEVAVPVNRWQPSLGETSDHSHAP